MTKTELAARLDQALEAFAAETRHLDAYSSAPVSEGELKEVVKQMYYVLDGFKDALLEYLDA